MSQCISVHGEYAWHNWDGAGFCVRCGLEQITEPGSPADRDVDRTLLGSLLAKLPEGYLAVVDDLGRAWIQQPPAAISDEWGLLS